MHDVYMDDNFNLQKTQISQVEYDLRLKKLNSSLAEKAANSNHNNDLCL